MCTKCSFILYGAANYFAVSLFLFLYSAPSFYRHARTEILKLRLSRIAMEENICMRIIHCKSAHKQARCHASLCA